jgi:2'-5' RNA ligase
MLNEMSRHLTVAFLGQANDELLLKAISTDFPFPSWKVGLAGIFDKCLFLPPEHARVVSWHARWLEGGSAISNFQTRLISWLKEKKFTPDDRHPFLPHITLARTPFDAKEWQNSFIQLPMLIYHLHLYESAGNLTYYPIWTHKMILPFEEIDHTADVAFRVHGESIPQLGIHAWTALTFQFPEILPYKADFTSAKSVDDIIMSLNQIVTEADAEIGCPFKAVSFHGDIRKNDQEILTWEMIVDV